MAVRDSAIDDVLAERNSYWLGQLERLLAQPSVSAQNLGIRECAQLLVEMLTEQGIAARVMETGGHPIVYGDVGDGPRTMLLYNHYDVQPPDPLDQWISPPFEPTWRDGKLYARGAEDDKGALVSRLAALEAFRRAHSGVPFRVKFLLDGGEEIGSPALEPFIRDHADLLAADACIWENGGVDEDGRPLVSFGLRGIQTAELRCRTIKGTAHSGSQAYLPNAIWRLVWALNTLKDREERVLIPGFYDDVLPMSQRTLDLLDAMPSIEEADKRQYEVEEFVLGLTGTGVNRFVVHPTCTINGISGGYEGEGSMTIIPGEARCKLDFRLVPDQKPEDILRKLRAHLDAQGFGDVEVVPGVGEYPAFCDPDDPFIALATRTAREVYGKEPFVEPFNGGSGPGYPFLAYLGVSFVSCGCGYDGGLGHAPNENMRTEDWDTGTKHMARIFEEFFLA
jgi:acetylornithine deacetylase/succinyl-diaminopimelate desuccinylase-like protein